MASIKILHASDLHISIHKQLRSPLDRIGDLNALRDMSAGEVMDTLKITKNLITMWWKRVATVSSYDPEILEALAKFIYENAKKKLDDDGSEIIEDGEEKLDAVVLTGDLATTGNRDDIERVSQFLGAKFNPRHPHKSGESDYRGATLSAVKVPVLYLPGNHDRYVPTRERYKEIIPKFFAPGGTNFDELLHDYRQHPISSIELTAEVSKDKRLRVVILAADFTLKSFDDHEGFYGWLAQGKVYSNICERLVAYTESLSEQKKEDEVLCVLWAIHFPPDYPQCSHHHRLLGEKEFIGAANRTGVSAVLAGHMHQQLTYRYPGMSFKVFCCGTTTQYEPPAMPGGRDETEAKKGNLFQIITVTASETGGVEISAKDYRYSSLGEQGDVRWMGWRGLP